jgi:glycosyltransferase involved in cell wall biosynthesis
VKILVLNPDLPVFPGRAGHEFLHATRLQAAGHRVGLVSLVHTHEQDQKKQGLTDAGVDLYLWRDARLDADGRSGDGARPGAIHVLVRAVHRALVGGVRPLDTIIQDHQFRNIAPAVLDALRDTDWNACVVVQSNCARWLDHLPRFPVSALVLHDVRSLVYSRRADTESSVFRRAFTRLEAWRYRKFERRYCGRFDLVVTVSEADEEWVRSHYRPAHLVTVPIPVDHEYFAPPDNATEFPNRIAFTGMMDHPPNVDAACFFARDVLPIVRRHVPDAEFWIVGRDPAPAVAGLSRLPGVVVTGFVPDIRPYMASAAVLVVPLRFGSGMRNKILEAWAMEKCVVTTRVGAEGLDFRDGENVAVADTADALASRVVELLIDSKKRDAIRTSGRRIVLARHDPSALAGQYGAALSAALRERRDSRRMHAVIDLRWMRPGVAGGIENLSRSFLANLSRLDHENRYSVLVPSVSRFEFDLRSTANIRVVPVDGPALDGRHVFRRGAALARWLLRSDSWQSPDVERLRQGHRLDADVALSIPGYIHPDLHVLSNVLICPDVQHEEMPQFFSDEAREERRRIYRDALARARHVCAISEFTRATLVERLGLPASKVTVTPLAADPMFEPGSPMRGRASAVLAKYDLPAGQYLYFPGNTWPHKNHTGAVQALKILGDTHGFRPLLVCSGAAREAHPSLVKRTAAFGLADRVRFLGYCPAEDMPALYEGAAALLFPSRYEGFGMPVLEAMWCGCPVVCSRTTSLPEIAGSAALLVAPENPAEIAEALAHVMADSDLRRTLIERGLARAATFSWSTFTTRVIQSLQAVHDSKWS